MKLVMIPLPFVGDSSVCVEQSSFPMHFVIQPVALILASFVVVKNPIAGPKPVFFLALIKSLTNLFLDQSAAGVLSFLTVFLVVGLAAAIKGVNIF